MVRHGAVAWPALLLAACGAVADVDPLDSLVSGETDTAETGRVDSDTDAVVDSDTDVPADTDPVDPLGPGQSVLLSGDQLVPPVTSAASAEARLRYDLVSGALSIRVAVAGTPAGKTFVTLEQGLYGEVTHTVALELERAPDAPLWSLPEAYVLQGKLREAFDRGQTFLRVSTAEAPEGVLRGQVGPPGVAFQTVALSSVGVPGSPEVEGSGQAFVTLDVVERMLTVSLRTEGLQPSDAFVVVGDVADDPIGNQRIGVSYFPPGENGLVRGSSRLAGAFWDAALAGSLYVVVFTGTYPEAQGRGALRGVLSPP